MARELSVITSEPLPALYSAWLETLLQGEIPREVLATCGTCAMVPTKDPPDPSTPGVAFHSLVRCCTYLPDLPNFLAGAVLSPNPLVSEAGRASLISRIRDQSSCSPLGVSKNAVFAVIYEKSRVGFGRAAALQCPHLDPDSQQCGIWGARNAVCSTWFCKHVRGKVGSDFWLSVRELLSTIERELAVWCALKLDVSADSICEAMRFHSGSQERHLDAELVVEEATKLRKLLWDPEVDAVSFYVQCYATASALTWEEVATICGPAITAKGRLVKQLYARLMNTQLPSAITLNPVKALKVQGGWYQVATYSSFNPIAIPPAVWDALHCFDGRPTDEVIAGLNPSVQAQLSANDLLQRLVDYDILSGET